MLKFAPFLAHGPNTIGLQATELWYTSVEMSPVLKEVQVPPPIDMPVPDIIGRIVAIHEGCRYPIAGAEANGDLLLDLVGHSSCISWVDGSPRLGSVKCCSQRESRRFGLC
jgi:hypothetical protein